jgi:hypothetical protein
VIAAEYWFTLYEYLTGERKEAFEKKLQTLCIDLDTEKGCSKKLPAGQSYPGTCELVPEKSLFYLHLLIDSTPC